MKGVSKSTVNNPKLRIYSELYDWTSNKQHGGYQLGRGLLTTTTRRAEGTGVMFQDMRKYSRKGRVKQHYNGLDNNILVPIGSTLTEL